MLRVHDHKAEELEAKGFYRRAAARWAEVMFLVSSDWERTEIAKRREWCLERARYTDTTPKVTAAELHEATNRTQKAMGIHTKSGERWRNYSVRKK